MDNAHFFLLLIAVVIGVIGISLFLAKKRTDGLRAWSPREGMHFQRDGGSVVSALSEFSLIGRSRRRKAYNVLSGGSGAKERWIFDFRYDDGSRRLNSTNRQTVVAFPYLNINLPAFEVRPENLLHKLGSTLGFQDIDFNEHPDFSSKYLLRGQRVFRIRQLFDSRVVHAFDCMTPLCVEAAGSCILIYRDRRVVAVDRLKDFVNTAERLCDAFVARATELDSTQPSVVGASVLLADS